MGKLSDMLRKHMGESYYPGIGKVDNTTRAWYVATVLGLLGMASKYSSGIGDGGEIHKIVSDAYFKVEKKMKEMSDFPGYDMKVMKDRFFEVQNKTKLPG